MTIPAGQSVPVTLTFAPQSSGTSNAALSVATNGGSTATQSLSGVGVAPTQHSVSLSWADSGSGVVGYNVFRGNASGGPYAQINSAPTTTAAYSDNTVVSGQTYYYVTTAVNGSGVESGYSNEAQGVIPTP
jgi:fibronectin type 3 domain-containing protein